VAASDRVKTFIGRLLSHGQVRPSVVAILSREYLAAAFLHGSGLEIGALHNPLPVPRGVHVAYVDRLSVADLRLQYPELRGKRLVAVDILDDGETLRTVGDQSQDFVIANHFLEHCEDPIGAIENFSRVLKVGGITFLAVPDKRSTFDRERPLTSLQHLLRDHEIGPANSRLQHLEEWTRFVGGMTDSDVVRQHVQDLQTSGYSIHFHVWTATSWLDFVLAIQAKLGLEIQAFFSAGGEAVTILRKQLNVPDGASIDRTARMAGPSQ